MPKLDSIAKLNEIDNSTSSVNNKAPNVVYDTIYNLTETTNKPEIEDKIQFISHNYDQSIPLLLILGLIIIGVAIYAFYKLLTDYITPFLQSHYKIKRPLLLLYRLKISTWVAYMFFSFYQLISSHITIGISLVTFVIPFR